MKRFIGILLLAAFVLPCFAFAACAGESTNSDTDAEREAWIHGYPIDAKWADIRQELKKRDDCVFVEGTDCVKGYDILTDFCSKVEAGTPAVLRYAQYFAQNMTGTAPVEISRIYFGFLEYDGTKFSVTVRGNLDETLRADRENFRYFKHDRETMPSTSAYKESESYYLVNDENVTYNQIAMSYSSTDAQQFPHAVLFTLGF